MRLVGVGLSLSVALGVFAACGTEADEGGFIAIDESEVVQATLEGDFVPGQYIAVLRSGADEDKVAARHGLAKGLSLKPQRAVVMKGVGAAQHAALKADGEVELVIPDAIGRIFGKPTKPGTTTPPAQVLPAGVDRVGGDETSNKGAGVTVCVVDTGIDYNHADLKANYVGGHDFINNDTNPMDDNGHGTHVAGTIAAVDNTGDVVGVAPAAKLLGVKVLSRRGSGSYSAITAGINYCVDQGADVINMSLGGSYNDPTQQAALQRAKDAGVTVVVAAGNDGVNLDTTAQYPASYDGLVITVAAAWVDDTSRAFGSSVSYPTFTNYGSAVDVTAPGVYVLSTKKGGGTTTMSGTSMACPHVAGGAALYLASNPGASPDAVEAAIEAAAENVNNVSVIPQEMLNVRSF